MTASPLSDIPPGDIERIEVIKGAAATTLYGTEAAAGVIQIFTKRGRYGAAHWNLQVDEGFNRLRPFSPSGSLNFVTKSDGSPDIYGDAAAQHGAVRARRTAPELRAQRQWRR